MNEFQEYFTGWVKITLRILLVFEALIFLLAAAFHLGLPNFSGISFLSLPLNLPAAIVEGTSGILFAISALVLFTRLSWARTSAMIAHSFALFGVMIGVLALSGAFSALAGNSPQSVVTNDLYYHMVMLVSILTGLALLLNPQGNAASIFRMLVRLTGAVQIFLGGIFWISDADGLIPYHILVGSMLVLSLWALAYLAARAGVYRGQVWLAVIWGLIVPVLGFAQVGLLPRSDHWIVQLIHLLVGLAAIVQAEGLARAMDNQVVRVRLQRQVDSSRRA